MILTLITQQISTLNLFTATSYMEKEEEENEYNSLRDRYIVRTLSTVLLRANDKLIDGCFDTFTPRAIKHILIIKSS